jgi:hypothetical protein
MNKSAMSKSMPTLTNGNTLTGDGGGGEEHGALHAQMKREIMSKTSPYKQGVAPSSPPAMRGKKL